MTDMTNDLMEKIEKAKQEALENPPKKKKGCTSCKKKKNVVETLPEIDLTPQNLIIYDEEDIVKAYHEMMNFGGIKEESKGFIRNVYKQLFNEEFVFDNCAGCKNAQYHKFRNYIMYNLKRNI